MTVDYSYNGYWQKCKKLHIYLSQGTYRAIHIGTSLSRTFSINTLWGKKIEKITKCSFNEDVYVSTQYMVEPRQSVRKNFVSSQIIFSVGETMK